MLKIILVDDDEIVLLVQRKLLQRCGISNRIHSFKGGIEALDYLKAENSSDKTLILLDINMPKMNGWQFLTKLGELESSANIFVIMVTSSIDEYDKEVAGKYKNVIGFMEKPITAENCSKIKNLPQLQHFFNS